MQKYDDLTEEYLKFCRKNEIKPGHYTSLAKFMRGAR